MRGEGDVVRAVFSCRDLSGTPGRGISEERITLLGAGVYWTDQKRKL
jgi:hypothetical protein